MGYQIIVTAAPQTPSAWASPKAPVPHQVHGRRSARSSLELTNTKASVLPYALAGPERTPIWLHSYMLTTQTCYTPHPRLPYPLMTLSDMSNNPPPAGLSCFRPLVAALNLPSVTGTYFHTNSYTASPPCDQSMTLAPTASKSPFHNQTAPPKKFACLIHRPPPKSSAYGWPQMTMDIGCLNTWQKKALHGLPGLELVPFIPERPGIASSHRPFPQ